MTRWPPVLYHIFRSPLPYKQSLVLQEEIFSIQHAQRKALMVEGLKESAALQQHPDILLLLQHRPVFTAGRRQTGDEIQEEETRLVNIGADFVKTNRGGEFTFHGPGQIVGYPLIDLSRRPSQSEESDQSFPPISVRDYVCRLEKALKLYLSHFHGITATPSLHTGVFLKNGNTKIASIGVQVRHRLTTHGFSVNVTREPLSWFNEVVACGLADVKAGCVEDYRSMASTWEGPLDMQVEMRRVVKSLGRKLEREMKELRPEEQGLIGQKITEMERLAESMEPWAVTPKK